MEELEEFEELRGLNENHRKYVHAFLETGNKTESYKIAYNKQNTVNSYNYRPAAYNLHKREDIKKAIRVIQKHLDSQSLMNKEYVLNHHKLMIDAWTELWELAKKQELSKEEKGRIYLLKEMVKGSDFRGSLQEVARLQGLYEQKEQEINLTFKADFG